MWSYRETQAPDELYHHGVLGMKWGVRRYQNKDGTLTEAGKKRQAKLEKKYYKLTKNDIRKTRDNYKSVSEMSDNELREKINRKKMEKEYKKLYSPEMTVTQKYATKILNDMVIAGVTLAGKKYITENITRALS